MSKRHLLLVQSTNEIKEDIGIVKINIPNTHKAVIARTKSTKILKNRYYLIKSVLCIIPVIPDSLKWTFTIQPIRRGGSRIFLRRGCTRLLLYFNTNKPHSFFFCRIPVVLENRRSSQRGAVSYTHLTLPTSDLV